MMAALPGNTSRSIRRHLIFGLSAVVLLVGGIGGWAGTTEFSGAVIAPGLVVVASSAKKVQHPVGGVIGEIRVKDGQRVKAGDIIVRLDATQTRANLGIITNQLDELAARQARLEAERDNVAEVAIPADLRVRQDQADVAALIAGELTLFDIRHAMQTGLKAQLSEQVKQLREQIGGLTEQASASERQIALVENELVGKRGLFKKKLTTVQEITPLEREKARLEGERGSLVARLAEVKGSIAELELKIIQIDHEFRTEAARQLAEIRAQAAELRERRVAAEDQLDRIDIRAPQSGLVHEMAVHTVGGVVGPAETLMHIVPDADDLTVEVHIQPQEIDQVHVGQAATLRFSAFNQRTTPEVSGTVSRVSADLVVDQRTGASYYTARIGVNESEIVRLGQSLVPGMPVEAFVRTADRTVLTYLTKPLTDQMQRSFRED
jgi:HlyD family secretion protein